MSTTQMQTLAEQLEQELERLAASRAAAADLEAERVSDPMDEIQQREELNLTATTLNAAFNRRRQIQLALERIREGRYGICEDCGEEVSLKRLEAAPWADLCITCQEAAEEELVAA